MSARRIKSGADIKTRGEFEQTITEIVSRQLVLERLRLRQNEALIAVREEFGRDIADVEAVMQADVIRAERFAAEHREELLPAKLKTAETAFAKFGFRLNTPSLVLLNRRWTWKTVLEALQKGCRFDLIITKEAPDKDAMKAALDTAGLAEFGTRIEQNEEFFIEPKRDPQDPLRLVAETREAA